MLLKIQPEEESKMKKLTRTIVAALLVNAVRHSSLGEITNALFEVGGQYRRNM